MVAEIGFRDYVLFDIEGVQYIAWPEARANNLASVHLKSARTKGIVTDTVLGVRTEMSYYSGLRFSFSKPQRSLS